MNFPRFNDTLTECLKKLSSEESFIDGADAKGGRNWVGIFEAVSGYLEILFRSFQEQEDKALHALLDSLRLFYEFWTQYGVFYLLIISY